MNYHRHSHSFTILFLLSIIFSLPVVNSSLDVPQKATAQNSSDSSIQETKALIDDAIQALKNNDTNKARIHINILNQRVAVLMPNTNTNAVVIVKILLSDATEATKNGDTSKAVAHLNLMVKNDSPHPHHY